MKKIIFTFLFLLTISFASYLQSQTNVSYQLSTHILDVNQGKPAKDVSIVLLKFNEKTSSFEQVTSYNTDENGRVGTFLPSITNNKGVYKLKFETLPYFENQNIKSIYPYIEVTFEIKDKEHYHIPITVSANGYSTYRGS